MGGIMSLTGERGGAPVKPGLPFADLTSGLWVAIAILAGLAGRGQDGPGCHIDFSMLDGQIALLTLAAARFFALGEVPPRLGTEHPGRVPSASFVCADGGYLHVTASDQHWLPLCKALGLEDWGSAPDLMSNSGRLRRRDEVMTRLNAAFAARRRDEVATALDEAGVPQGPIRAVDEILGDEHVAARRLVEKFSHPGIGEFPALRTPFRLDGFDDPAVMRPPLLGEHTEEVLSTRLGLSRARIAALREAKAI